MIRTTTGKAHEPIARMEPFTTSGSLAGHHGGDCRGPWATGRLAESEPLYRAVRDGVATYVVTSYATPIAAVVDGQWVITFQRFSITTSRHQSQARYGAALSGLAVEEVAFDFAAQEYREVSPSDLPLVAVTTN